VKVEDWRKRDSSWAVRTRYSLSIWRIPLHKAWLTIPYSGLPLRSQYGHSTEKRTYRSSMEASTDVKADARGNSRSTKDSNDGSGHQLISQLQERGIPNDRSTLHSAPFNRCTSSSGS
jgi:hypothetical protein